MEILSDKIQNVIIFSQNLAILLAKFEVWWDKCSVSVEETWVALLYFDTMQKC